LHCQPAGGFHLAKGLNSFALRVVTQATMSTERLECLLKSYFNKTISIEEVFLCIDIGLMRKRVSEAVFVLARYLIHAVKALGRNDDFELQL
jgi:hypothetical protein